MYSQTLVCVSWLLWIMRQWNGSTCTTQETDCFGLSLENSCLLHTPAITFEGPRMAMSIFIKYITIVSFFPHLSQHYTVSFFKSSMTQLEIIFEKQNLNSSLCMCISTSTTIWNENENTSCCYWTILASLLKITWTQMWSFISEFYHPKLKRFMPKPYSLNFHNLVVSLIVWIVGSHLFFLFHKTPFYFFLMISL